MLISCLQFSGFSIGHKPYFQIEKARHTANINSVLVGDTSKARKGTSLRWVTDLFNIVDPELKRCIASGLSSSEGLIERVRDPKQGANGTFDSGVTDKRLSVPEEEFAKVLNVMKRDGNTLSATVRDAWDGKRLQTLARQNHDIATDAHIAIQGHITSEELKSKLTKDDSYNGFANRFLWVMAKRSKSLPRGGNVDEVALNGLAARIRCVVFWATNVEFVDMDEETKHLWDGRYEELMQGSSGLFGALTDRNTAQNPAVGVELMRCLIQTLLMIRICVGYLFASHI